VVRPLSRHARLAGVTLLELMTVIVIIGILATMLIPATSAMFSRMEKAKCIFNLKALWVGTEFFLQDRMYWPQIDARLLQDKQSDQYARQWMAALEPYKVSKETWHCPTVGKQLPAEVKSGAAKKERIDYFPTPFDNKQMTPHRWPDQPWFIERGAVHGEGNLIIFPDGSIKTLDQLIAKQKKK